MVYFAASAGGKHKMSVWSHILLEAYCTYSFASQKTWKGYSMLKNGKFSKKAHITKNEDYIPKSERPKWCKENNKERLPYYKCFECRGKRCPFFAYVNAEKSDYKLFFKAFNKECKNEQKRND